MKKNYKFSAILIGLGNIGFKYDINKKQIKTHAKSLSLNNNFKVFCGIDQSKYILKKFKKIYNMECYKSISLFKKDFKIINLDLLIISVNTEQIYSIYKESVKNFNIRCILIEKPVSYKLNEIEFILRDSIKRNIKVFINFPRNSLIQNTKFKNIFLNLYNKIEYININYNNGMKNNGLHFIMILYYFFGLNLKFNIVKKFPNKNTGDVNYSLVINYKKINSFLNYRKKINLNDIIIYIKTKNGYLKWFKNNDIIFIDKTNKNLIRKKITNISKNYQKEVLLNIEKFLNKKKYSLIDINEYFLIAKKVYNLVK